MRIPALFVDETKATNNNCYGRNIPCVIETYDVVNLRVRPPENRSKNNLLKNNRIRFRHRRRRLEVTSQCYRVGNESRTIDRDGGSDDGSGTGFFDNADFIASAGSTALSRATSADFGSNHWRLCFSLVEKISEKNSSPTALGPIPSRAVFLFLLRGFVWQTQTNTESSRLYFYLGLSAICFRCRIWWNPLFGVFFCSNCLKMLVAHH